MRKNTVRNLSPKSPALETALDLIDEDRHVEADLLLTAALLDSPGEPGLWLAAGICRLRRGAWRSAGQALRMSAWLSDEPLARDLLEACREAS
ncbi:MAG: hypothetical protein PHU25_19385 [Deltaproteobacteria bacterium]|nr:hypothetical protein [Deltaproteobacteria bacterium]